jgi:hypothetical protein
MNDNDYNKKFCTACDHYRGYICVEHREPSYKELQQQLMMAEKMSETRRAMLVDSYNNVTELCKEKDRYQSLFEEEKKSNLNNVMCYGEQVKDLQNELKSMNANRETWNNR